MYLEDASGHLISDPEIERDGSQTESVDLVVMLILVLNLSLGSRRMLFLFRTTYARSNPLALCSRSLNFSLRLGKYGPAILYRGR